MKIIIIQFDTRNDNQLINQMLNLNKKYCNIHNYDYIFDHFSNINQIRHDWQDLLINQENIFKLRLYYHRFQLLDKYLNQGGYDYIVSIDSDIAVSNPTIRIQDFIDNQHQFYIGQDCGIFATTVHLAGIGITLYNYCRKNNIAYIINPNQNFLKMKVYGDPINLLLKKLIVNYNGYNAGFMILKNTNRIKQFIKDCKKHYIMFQQGLFDQGCISTMIMKKKYKGMLKQLPLQTQGNPIFSINQYRDFVYNQDKNFLCHPYGWTKNYEQIKQVVNKLKNNKWWRNIK